VKGGGAGGAAGAGVAFNRDGSAHRTNPNVVRVETIAVVETSSRGSTDAVVGTEVAGVDAVGGGRAQSTTVAVAVVGQLGIGREIGAFQTGSATSFVLRWQESAAPVVFQNVRAAESGATELASVRIAIRVGHARFRSARVGIFERWCLGRYYGDKSYTEQHHE